MDIPYVDTSRKEWARQAPLSMGFSRQGYRLFSHSVLFVCDPMDCKPARILCPWVILQAGILEWVAISFIQGYRSGKLFPSPGHLPDPGIKPTSPALADGFFTKEPPGKPLSVSKVGFSAFEMWAITEICSAGSLDSTLSLLVVPLPPSLGQPKLSWDVAKHFIIEEEELSPGENHRFRRLEGQCQK